MRPRLDAVLTRLRDEGVLSSDDLALARRVAASPAARRHDTSAPWYVRLLAAMGAWIAAIIFLLFCVMVDLLKSEEASALLGAVILAGATLLRRQVRHDFTVQLCLAGALLGQVLLLFGLTEILDWKEGGLGAAMVVLNGALLFLNRDPIHRFLATAAVVTGLLIVLHEVGVGRPGAVLAVPVAAAAVALFEARWGERSAAELGGLVAHGAVVSFLGLLIFDVVESRWSKTPATWAATAGLCAVLLWLQARILKAHGVPLRSQPAIVTFAVTLLLAVVTASTPGISAAAIVLALGFHRRNVFLLGLAAVFFAYFTGQYYYLLSLTLLQKSGVLILSGGLALGARWYLQRRRAPA
jgi:hypothetical protein